MKNLISFQINRVEILPLILLQIYSSIKAEVFEIHWKWPVAHLGICSQLSRLCRLPTEQMLLWGHYHSEHKPCQSQGKKYIYVHLSCTSILLPETRNDVTEFIQASFFWLLPLTTTPPHTQLQPS